MVALVHKTNQSDFGIVPMVVNATSKTCGMANIAHIRGDKVGETHFKTQPLDILEIAVIAVQDRNHYEPVPPQKQITVFEVKSEEL